MDGTKNNAWKNLFPLILKFKIIEIKKPNVSPQNILAADNKKVLNNALQNVLSARIVL